MRVRTAHFHDGPSQDGQIQDGQIRDGPSYFYVEYNKEIYDKDISIVLNESVIHDQGVTYTIMEGVSQKKTKLLITSTGFSYGLKRENKSGVVIWRCTTRSRKTYCHATIRQRGDVFEQGLVNHIHPSTPDNELKKQVYSKVRALSCQQVYRPALSIAEQVLLENASENHVCIPKKALLKRVANRTRAAMRPSEPRSLDFEVDHAFINSDEFLIADLSEDGQRHFVFSTRYQLSLLSTAKRWYIDGTCKILGAPFRRQGQLMSIHAFIEKDGKTQQMPLVFCLMSRRTKEDYIKVFRSIKEHMDNLAVEGFVVDFEKAAWQAIRTSFPRVSIMGCVFHWTQAVWRHVQQLGLAETYRQRTGLHSFVRQLLALPFLPHLHIPRAMDALTAQASTPQTQSLINYVRDQWIDSSVFPPECWSVFKQTVRTNNDVEGWHHRLNSKAVHSGLQFYELVPLLKREADIVHLTVSAGDFNRNVRGRSRMVQTRLEVLWTNYMNSDITTSAFLRSCAELYGVRM